MIFIKRVSVLIIELVVLFIYELEYAVVVVPEHIAVVFVLLIIINRALNNVPDIISRALAEAGSVNSCSVGAFPVKFRFRGGVFVYASVK